MSAARTGRGGVRRTAAGTALGIALALGTTGASALTLAGVDVEPTLEAAGAPLELAGAGIRTKFFVKLYVASLYVAPGTDKTDAAAIVDADAPMAITLDVVSDRVTREKMIEALREGFSASTGGDTAPVQDGIDRMLGAMDAPIEDGSSYTLAYEPGVGTRMLREGEELLVVEGVAFKRALFGIWLSDAPAQDSLKKAMTSG